MPTLPQPRERRARYATIVALALPIIAGMISQNVLNLVDTWMVGKKGAAALAAVGTGSMVNFMAVAAVMGLSASVQAMAARRHGEKRFDESAAPLNTALLIALGFGIPLTLLLVPLTPWIFGWLNPDPKVATTGAGYLAARIIGLTAAGVNFSFRGYWNGTDRSRLYMWTLVLIHSVNILLNWVLIFGNWGFPEYGAVGAGIASAVATYVGSGCYVLLALRHAKHNGFLKRWANKTDTRTIIRLALPNSLQQLLFASGFVALFWILGRLGTIETAAAGVLINVMLVAILPGLGLGITCTSLVSQALGRRAPEDAKRWGWDTAQVSVIVALIIALPMWLFTDSILMPFLHDQRAVELARWPLRVFAAAILLDSPGTVLQQALLGAGANRSVMQVSAVCQWGVFLPLAYVVGPVLGFGLLGIWWAQAGYRILQAGIHALMWQAGRWTTIKI